MARKKLDKSEVSVNVDEATGKVDVSVETIGNLDDFAKKMTESFTSALSNSGLGSKLDTLIKGQEKIFSGKDDKSITTVKGGISGQLTSLNKSINALYEVIEKLKKDGLTVKETGGSTRSTSRTSTKKDDYTLGELITKNISVIENNLRNETRKLEEKQSKELDNMYKSILNAGKESEKVMSQVQDVLVKGKVKKGLRILPFLYKERAIENFLYESGFQEAQTETKQLESYEKASDEFARWSSGGKQRGRRINELTHFGTGNKILSRYQEGQFMVSYQEEAIKTKIKEQQREAEERVRINRIAEKEIARQEREREKEKRKRLIKDYKEISDYFKDTSKSARYADLSKPFMERPNTKGIIDFLTFKKEKDQDELANLIANERERRAEMRNLSDYISSAVNREKEAKQKKEEAEREVREAKQQIAEDKKREREESQNSGQQGGMQNLLLRLLPHTGINSFIRGLARINPLLAGVTFVMRGLWRTLDRALGIGQAFNDLLNIIIYNIINKTTDFMGHIASMRHGRMGAGTISTSTMPTTNIGTTSGSFRRGGIFGGHRITSEYTPDGVDSAGRSTRRHMGVDLKYNRGEKVNAFIGGTVIASSTEKNWGNYKVIQDEKGVQHLYAHLDNLQGAKVGDKISAGELLGYAGSTGRSSGSHLHYEVATGNIQKRGDRSYVDPLGYVQSFQEREIRRQEELNNKKQQELQNASSDKKVDISGASYSDRDILRNTITNSMPYLSEGSVSGNDLFKNGLTYGMNILGGAP